MRGIYSAKQHKTNQIGPLNTDFRSNRFGWLWGNYAGVHGQFADSTCSIAAGILPLRRGEEERADFDFTAFQRHRMGKWVTGGQSGPYVQI